MKTFLHSILFILIEFCAFAQSTNVSTLFQSDLKKAESFYEAMAYQNALDFYINSEKKNPDNKLVKDRIADCYARLGKYEEARACYEKILERSDAAPIDYFHYGQVLSRLEAYDKAYDAYKFYADHAKQDKRTASRLQFLKQFDFHLRDSSLYTLENLWFNSDQSDFAPHFYQDRIVFISARDRDQFIKRKSMSALHENEALLNTFIVNIEFDSAKTKEEQVQLFYSKDLNSNFHDGPIDFYDNDQKIAFSRNYLEEGKPIKDKRGRINLGLYFAELNDNLKLDKLRPFEFNNPDYSLGHPWVSPNGALLLFTSDKPGGFGGADIYSCKLENGKWGAPINLGGFVNTAGDEFNPTMINDSILFFASNGHGGFGGLDNFVSKLEAYGFGEAHNMGSPINSSQDDFALIMSSNGRDGYISSNRKGGFGFDDIYKFSLNYFTLLGTVIESETKKALADADIVIKDSVGNQTIMAKSDSDGNFFLPLQWENHYTIAASKKGYTSLKDASISTHNATITSDTLVLSIWENNLFAEGIIYSNETQLPLAGANVLLENLNTGKIDTLIVGPKGDYKFSILPDNKYKVSALKEGFLPDDFVINTKNIYKGKLLNDMVLEEEFLEKFVVLFDFNKKDIKESFKKDLNKMIADLKRAPKATLNIAAHADTQGEKNYNLKLSNARAKELVQYFTKAGISAKRIEAIGFGEELILNQCSDGVECTDEDHALNRRAELKIQLAESIKSN